MSITKNIAGINGFGRFGLGLFKSWFQDVNSPYKIMFINDEALTIDDIIKILKNDTIVTDFNNLRISKKKDLLFIQRPSGKTARIYITHGPISNAFWVGKPDFMFECSGRIQNHKLSRKFLISNTKHVIISAVTPLVDTIIIYGYNHKEFKPKTDKILSFGSCTVIPGVLLISLIHYNYEIIDCTINIIHSVPKWRLERGMPNSLIRKTCSLETVAPKLVHHFKKDNIKVNYTYVPYYGASLMDFHFILKKTISKNGFISLLTKEIKSGKFRNIIKIDGKDYGSEKYLNSPFSIVLIKSSIDVRRNNLYLFGYFNNEGSGIRLHELISYIITII